MDYASVPSATSNSRKTDSSARLPAMSKASLSSIALAVACFGVAAMCVFGGLVLEILGVGNVLNGGVYIQGRGRLVLIFFGGFFWLVAFAFVRFGIRTIKER